MKLINVSNHNLTEQQKQDAMDTLGVTEFIDLQQDLKAKLGNLKPTDVYEVATEIKDFILNQGNDIIVHLAGFMDLVQWLIQELHSYNIKVVYSYTQRIVQEQIKDNGAIEKKVIFEHQGWYSYSYFM